MKRTTHSRIRSALTCAVLVVAAAGLTGCPCTTIDDAKNWVVIHDGVVADSDSPGGEWTACVPAPGPGGNVAFLPGCLDVDKNDKIGFVNYSKTDVTIRHFGSLDAPNDPLELPKGSEKIFTVTVEGQRLPLEIVSVGSHGGPEIIIRP